MFGEIVEKFAFDLIDECGRAADYSDAFHGFLGMVIRVNTGFSRFLRFSRISSIPGISRFSGCSEFSVFGEMPGGQAGHSLKKFNRIPVSDRYFCWC